MIEVLTKPNQITKHCCDTFHKYGIKSVTMDDIARELGFSKKTLYAHFPNKASLVAATIKQENEEVHTEMNEIIASTKHAIDEVFAVSNYIAHKFGDCNPAMLSDMQKYYPAAWRLHEQFKFEVAYESVVNNMKRGVKEGLYRNSFNQDIITKLYLVKLESFFNHDLFPPSTYTFAGVHKEFIIYHIRGMATTKGLKILEQYEKV